MKGRYPGGKSERQWSRMPFGEKHRLVGVAINHQLGYWRTCQDRRCRRARACQDYNCYWRRLMELPDDARRPIRTAAAPFAELLWIGSSKGAQRYQVY